MGKPVLLAVCDTPTVHTGFGNVSKNVLENIGGGWDIHVIGVNYYGDPHPLQSKYKLYTPTLGGDVYGMGRLREVVDKINPDVIWLLNDPWLCSEYILRLRKYYKGAIVVYTPVDSPGIKPQFIQPLNAANHVIAYTEWGLSELRASGLKTKTSVIPHGADLTHFKPIQRNLARKELFKGSSSSNVNIDDMFIVLYTARNQMRKRVDLFPYIIAEWMKKYPHDNVFFHYHGAPSGDLGWDIEYIAHKYKVDQRLIITSRDITADRGLPIDKMKYVYSGADVYLQICANEGWSMPLHEAMACKVPSIVPRYSALGDWPGDSVYYCGVDPTPWHNPNNIDTEHRFIDVASAVESLETLYTNSELRAEYAQKAYSHATQQKYSWRVIGNQFNRIFESERNAELKDDPELWKKLQPQLQL